MTFKSRFNAIPLAAALAASVVTLSACAPVVVGGAAAGAAVVVTDRRTSGTQLDDQNISFKVEHAISQKLGDTAHVSANTYEGVVLLTGEVPNDAAKAQATSLAQGIEKVKKVVNQLTIGPASSFSVRSNDTWLSSKVRSELLNTKFVPSGSISVTTDKSVVYLQGKVTQAEGEYAANAAAGVSGVTKVVKLFDIISREEAVRLSGSTAGSSAAPANAAPQRAPIETGGGASDAAAPAGGGGAQAMPIK
ncbi:BON domain-containing protein [Bordetella genomosp. 11]|uniref:Phospholipid-binding protein n=1 Tax=Bordetella genomosp. 11 TaxID=1416808 RepID=A0A261UX43_9BORD|nr:BON domain-containing protein [Bordetella genomosp. 11]OZI66449.1 phospholipid-binding protein [Bordetella genomosp. 11]